MLYNIYFSPTGGTKRVADILAQGLGGPRTDIDLCDRQTDFGRFSFAADDVCLISVPAYGGRAPAAAMERLGRMAGGGAAAVPVAVFGNRDIDDTLLELKDALSAGGFLCVGAVSAVAEHSIARQVATGRPDVDDRRELLAFAEKLKEKLSAERPGEVEVPGDRPYRAFGGTPLKPVGGVNCIQCGRCASECPVGAIPEDDFTGVDKAACISCLRCMVVCPVQCRSVNSRAVAAMTQKLKAGCARRRGNTLFL